MKGLATLLVKEQGVGIETPQQTPADIIKKYQDTHAAITVDFDIYSTSNRNFFTSNL